MGVLFFVGSTRYKPGKAHESTEETEFRQQQAMQKQLTQAIRKNQAGMEAASRAAYSGNVRSTKPLTVGFGFGFGFDFGF